jgi:hypothetical protein
VWETTALTKKLTVWELIFYSCKPVIVASVFQVPTRLTTVTRQNSEYKVDVTRHPKFPLAFGELVCFSMIVLGEENSPVSCCVNQFFFCNYSYVVHTEYILIFFHQLNIDHRNKTTES